MIVTISIIFAFLIIAVIVFLLEIFVFPGLTLAGVGSVIFAIGGIVYAYYSERVLVGHITLISFLVIFTGLFYWVFKSKSLQQMSLKTNVDSTLVSPRSIGLHEGDEGVTLSRLAPIGQVLFGQTITEAKALENFIDEQTKVVIIAVEGYHVIVKSIQKS
jgi:membrane-bound ClpP family serine protease